MREWEDLTSCNEEAWEEIEIAWVWGPRDDQHHNRDFFENENWTERRERERGMTRWRSLPPSSAGGPDSQAKQRIYCCLWFFLRSFSMPSLLLMFHLLFYVFQENTETLLHISLFLAFHPRKWLFIFKCICICWVWLRRRGAEGRKRKRGIEDDGRGRLAKDSKSVLCR